MKNFILVLLVSFLTGSFALADVDYDQPVSYKMSRQDHIQLIRHMEDIELKVMVPYPLDLTKSLQGYDLKEFFIEMQKFMVENDYYDYGTCNQVSGPNYRCEVNLGPYKFSVPVQRKVSYGLVRAINIDKSVSAGLRK